MRFRLPDILHSTWVRQIDQAAMPVGLLMACFDPTKTAGLLVLSAMAIFARLPGLRRTTRRKQLETACYALGLVLLWVPGAELVGLLFMLASLVTRLRPPVVLLSKSVEVVEGGVRDRHARRWIAFHGIEKIAYDEPVVELTGKGNSRLVAWHQAQNALPVLRELEAGVYLARQASDPLQLGRGEMTTEAWLSGLERRFCDVQQYRCQAIAVQELVSVLRDTRNRADVRAGAAFALLSRYPHEGVPIVRSQLSDRSAPLLIAMAGLLSPGIVDNECLSEARLYLSSEESAAIESFAGRSVARKFRVAGDVPAGEPVEIQADGDAMPGTSLHCV